MSIIELLFIKRKERKLTQSEVAAFIGVAQNTYAQYETGTRSPHIDTLIKLADLFDCSLDELVGRKKEG